MKSAISVSLASMTLALALTGCGPATQNIPVSTDPSGALVFVDGQQTCTTPCNAALDKTQDHILTIRKDGYQQADVQVVRQYDTAGVARDAAQSGMSTSSMGASTEGAIANALLATSTDEATGNAYVLSPSTVTVRLSQAGQAPADPNAPITISSDQLDPKDRQTLIKTTQPTTLGSAVAENPEKAAEALLEAGAVASPTIGTSKDFKNSHSSESYGGDGSYNKTTTSTSAKVGVSVNPAEAGLGLLHLLEDAEGKPADSESSE